ncbi:phage shock protein B [Pseudomonas plecoglossicida]|uniref:hypothetical protein n=1 Tax=Pseudomonas plecoglossicida TaxID=70775 RepID=UPI0015E2A203|nr:hypothetical protein [Pseudomonas plecoglossicida]MBA1195570.1 phage shock protein B [Pseudomonas plecoglossicida]
MKPQAGGIAFGLLALLCLCLLGGYGFGLLTQYIDPSKQLVPVALTSILIAPIGLIAQAISKYGEIKKIKGLSRDEQRRLDEIVDPKRLSMFWRLGFFLLSTAAVATLFYVATLKDVPFNAPLWALRFTGFILAYAVISSIKIYFDLATIQDYETKVTRRMEERKSRAALLKKLGASESNK